MPWKVQVEQHLRDGEIADAYLAQFEEGHRVELTEGDVFGYLIVVTPGFYEFSLELLECVVQMLPCQQAVARGIPVSRSNKSRFHRWSLKFECLLGLLRQVIR